MPRPPPGTATEVSSSMPERPSSRRIRIWPVWLILLLAGAALAFVCLTEARNRQERVMQVMGVLLATALALLGWWTFASRISWRARTIGLAIVALLLGAFWSSYEQVGVTGDLVPIYRFRFASPPPDVVRDEDEVVRLPHADHPTFLGGMERSGVHEAGGLTTDWEARPPVRLWERELGESFSGFAVRGRRAVTMEQRSDLECAVAYDLDTGRELWVNSWEARYTSSVAGTGPRATPTIEGERVFALGALGELRALELDSGELLWSRRLTVDHDCGVPDWGFSGSPLVLDGKVIVSPGGPGGHSLVAYAVPDGELVWHAGDDRPGYAAPMLVTLAGLSQVVIFNGTTVAGHHPTSGEPLWSHAWGGERPQCAQPLVIDEHHLLVSTGYSVGACLIELARQEDGSLSTREVWRSIRMRSKFANLIHEESAIYGLDDGTLACLDPETGKRLWKDGRFGHGQLVKLGDHLLVQTEEGELVLVAFDRDELRVVTRMQPLEGRTWNPPTIAWPYVLVRNERRVVCLRFDAKP